MYIHSSGLCHNLIITRGYSITTMKTIKVQFNDRQMNVLEDYANIHHKGDISRAITSLMSVGFKVKGYSAGGQRLCVMGPAN